MNQLHNIEGKITKEMPIAEILDSFPDKAMLISEILLDFGIHCVGCGASSFETLEEGVLGHGYSEEELDKLVSDLNEAISKETKVIEIKDFSLTLTQNAIKKLKEIMKSEGKESSYLRASVLSGGCSGYTYDLELVDNKAKGDIQIDQDGVSILVSNESAEYLSGTKIDFIDTLNESGFKFLNPNATKECGCGKSFS